MMLLKVKSPYIKVLFMSNDNHLTASTDMPYPFYLSPALSNTEQQTISTLLNLLPVHAIDNLQVSAAQISSTKADYKAQVMIKKIVDGRGLACPMPLLKTKVALREVNANEALYVVATDPNSQADITAFCAQTRQNPNAETLLLLVNQATDSTSISDNSQSSTDTIFHFIITKTDSN